MFDSIFSNGNIVPVNLLIVLATSLVCGFIFSFLSCYRSKSSSSFFVCISLLPMAVAMVIALVNGNLGVGVAVAGAFSLVRFRSAPGSAKEISSIFIAMVGGLAFGTGYLAYGIIFLLICGILLFGFEKFMEKERIKRNTEKIIKIVIPESLDYTSVFEEVFKNYTSSYQLINVKTINMGSMFKLSYQVNLKNLNVEKTLIDELRIRNGNLEIQCTRVEFEDNKEL